MYILVLPSHVQQQQHFKAPQVKWYIYHEYYFLTPNEKFFNIGQVNMCFLSLEPVREGYKCYITSLTAISDIYLGCGRNDGSDTLEAVSTTILYSYA